MSRYHIAHLLMQEMPQHENAVTSPAFLIEAAGKRRITDLAAKHGLSEDEIRAMAEFDPTENDKFLGWIAKQVADGELSIPTDGPELKTMLEDFGRKGKLTGEPDINKWTFTGLREKLGETESKGEVNRSKVKGGQRVFFDEPPWKVIKIMTPEAASKLLRPEWCIKDKKYWKQYGCSARRPAYLILKNGKKYACMVPHKGELKGTDDEPLRSTKMFAKLLKKLAPRMKITWVSDLLKLEHLVKPIEEIAADPESAYNYARFIVGGRWLDGEAAIATDPKLARDYAEDVVEGPWPSGEAAIARDSKSAYEYALRVVEGRFLEGEVAIAVSKWAFDYAIRVVKGRWPKGEAEIASRSVQYELEMYGDLVGDPDWADKYGKAASRVGRYHIAYLLIAGDDEYEPWSFPWIQPEDAAWGLAEYGEDDDIIHDLVSSEGRELAETFDSPPDPMEIWRTLSLPSGGLKEDSIGVYWSWSKAGAIAHIAVDGLTGNVSLLHAEVEKRNVNWPSTFAANMSSYQEEAEIYLNAGTPVRLLDIDGETDERTSVPEGCHVRQLPVSRYHTANLLIEGASKSAALKPNYLDIGHDDDFILWQYDMSTGLKTVTQDELMAEHEFTGADEFHDISKDTVARGRIDFDRSIGSVIFEDVPEKWQKKAIEALMAEAFPVRFVVFSDKSLSPQMSLSQYWQTLFDSAGRHGHSRRARCQA